MFMSAYMVSAVTVLLRVQLHILSKYICIYTCISIYCKYIHMYLHTCICIHILFMSAYMVSAVTVLLRVQLHILGKYIYYACIYVYL
jgi:hypothetical protein